MRILLDSSGYVAFMRGHRQIKQVVQEADEILVSSVVLGELLAGFRRGGRPEENRQELEGFLSSPRVEVVPVDRETSESYAVIVEALRASGTPLPINDVWIAATALQHGAPVLTTDAHFLKIPQIVVRHYEVS